MKKKRYIVDIVIADKGWILEKLAQEIVNSANRDEHNLFDIKILTEPSGCADLTYFLPYSVQRSVEHGLVGSYFSHREELPEAKKKFMNNALLADFCIVKADRYQKILSDAGAKNIRKIVTGIDLELFKPKVRLGIIGRVYPDTGRKGEHLLARIGGLPNVEMVFAGEGWPYTGTYYDDLELVNFYNSIDYLLVPSLIEGGPVPVHEALACGKQVIAPDVGFIPNYPHIPYKTGDEDDLLRVVCELVEQRLELRKSVENHTWAAWGESHLDAFIKILSEKIGNNQENYTSSSSEEPQLLRISLFIHGSELEKDKGGPSVRSALIRDELTKRGFVVEIHSTISDLQVFCPDVVHVFNSWPLENARKAMRVLSTLNIPIVYSPIALNLGGREIFDSAVTALLLDRNKEKTNEELKRLSRSITMAMGEETGTTPIEGVQGHFDALRETTELSDWIITLSGAEADFLVSLNVDRNKLVHVPNGTDVETMAAGDTEYFRQTFGLDRYVLCVGRIESRKNQAALAYTFRSIDVPLVLVGHPGSDSYMKIVQTNGNERLIWIDRIEDRQLLASAYKGANAFVLTSWCEGASLSVIEAGAAGTPLFLSDRSSEREYFGEHATYIDPGDLHNLRIAIKKELNNPEPPERREKRSLFVRERYSVERHVTGTLEVYRKATELTVGRSVNRRYASKRHYLDVTKAYSVARHDIEVTGVPAVEFGIIEEALRKGHNDFVAWDREFRTFVPIALNPGNKESIRKQLSIVDPRNTNGLAVNPKVFHTIRYPARRKIYIRQYRQKLDNLVFGTLNLLPSSISMPILTILKKWKNFKKAIKQKSRFAEGSNRRRQQNDNNPPIALPRYQIGYQLNRLGWKFNPKDKLTVLGHTWQHDNDYFQDLLAAKRKADLDLGVLVHDLAFFQAPSILFSWRERGESQSRTWEMAREVSRFYATSHQSQHQLHELRLAGSGNYKVERVRLGDATPVSKDKSVKGLQSGRFLLLVSSFHPRKNQDLLTEVWSSMQRDLQDARMADIKLVLAGAFQRGSGEYADTSFAQAMDQVGIKVLGPVSDSQITWLYRHCLLTLYPSFFEGWGLPVIESLQYGKVCLASSQIPAAREVANGAIIRLDPFDFFGWRKSLSAFLFNPRMREAFEKEARSYKTIGYTDITTSILDA